MRLFFFFQLQFGAVIWCLTAFPPNPAIGLSPLGLETAFWRSVPRAGVAVVFCYTEARCFLRDEFYLAALSPLVFRATL